MKAEVQIDAPIDTCQALRRDLGSSNADEFPLSQKSRPDTLHNLDGDIIADGEGRSCCSVGGGSGGGIRIDVGTLSGSGRITSIGGRTPDFGGGGRIAIITKMQQGLILTRR